MGKKLLYDYQEAQFIPPTTERILKNINDVGIMNAAIEDFFECNYKQMKGLILEYGEEKFFSDLYRYFNAGYWRNSANRYVTFAGMTIAFCKMYK
jgi:hypothetical protein